MLSLSNDIDKPRPKMEQNKDNKAVIIVAIFSEENIFPTTNVGRRRKLIV